MKPIPMDPRGSAPVPGGPRQYDASVYEWFAIQAHRAPDATALVCGSQTLTYRELRDWSRGVSARLHDRGVARNDIVGVCVDKSPAAYAAILGVLGAGAAYLPIEPSWPEAFIESILREAGSERVVTEALHAAVVRQLGCDAVCVSGDERGDAPPSLPAPDGLSYVLCTSGSTGRPKATCFDHLALTRVAAWQMERSGCRAGMRTAQFSVLSFDVSLQEMFSTWSSGGALIVVPPAVRTDAASLLEFLRAERIERLFIPIAVLGAMAQAAADAPVERLALREIVCSGDTMLLSESTIGFFRRLPGCTLDNQYGPTETHAVTAFRLSGDPDTWPARPPIGAPVGGARVYLLDDNLSPVAPGEEGEIFVSGPGLARGYIGRPDLTKERFLPCPFSEEPGARMYRTGDLARQVEGDVLEFHGRRDLQVKIRGYRVELAEVESVLMRHPAVADAAVIATAAGHGAKVLIAFYVSACDESADDLQRFVARSLPSFAVPSRWIRVASLPLNANGKVDRRRLEADLESARPVAVERLEGCEQGLAEIWSEVLQTARITRSSNFLELGGDSLAATRITRLIELRLGVRLSIGQLFQTPTLAALASALPAANAGPVGGVPVPVEAVRERDQPFPLTDVQLAYVAARSGAVVSPSRAAHVYVEYDADAPDLDRVGRAIRELLRRHEVLRALAREDGQHHPAGDPADWRLEVHDLRELNANDRGDRLQSLRASVGHTPRELDQWPSFSVLACKVADDSVRFLIRFDLLAGDLRSMQILVREFGLLYRGLELQRAGRPFRDFVSSTRGIRDSAEFATAAAYWLQRLDDMPDAPALPLRPRALERRGCEFTRRTSHLSREATARIDDRARIHGVTKSGALLAAYAAVLAKWSDEPRFTITLPILDRSEDGWDDMVGDFSSVLPVVVDTTAAGGFASLAQAVQRQLLADLEHRKFSAIDLLRRLPSRRGHALPSPFGVVFTSTLSAGLTGIEAAILGWHERVHYSVVHTPQVWLDLQVGEVDGKLHYNQDSIDAMFEDGTPAAMAGAFHRLLEWLSAEGTDWREPVPCLTPKADLALYRIANDVAADRPRQTLHGLFLEKAAEQPDSPAVIWNSGHLTYRQLHQHALTVSRQLKDRGVVAGSRVGVALEKGWRQVAAVLGVQYLGAAYVPVDVSWPSARIEAVLRSAEVACVLTRDDAPDSWLTGLHACVIAERIDPGANIEPAQTDDGEIAYIIYTSGSTGVPKGVVIDHRGAVNTILDVNERWGIGPGDRVLALSSIAFDLSVWDIFGLLAAGGTIVFPEPDTLRDPDRWIDSIARHRVTLWNSVPALLDMLVTSGRAHAPAALGSLRLVLSSGDWIPKSLYPRIKSACPGVRVIGLGGATEASIWSVYHEITGDEPTESVPYGRALTNQALYVCDAAMRQRPVGATGELYIGGSGVAIEYFRDAGRTSAQFVDHPTWGRLFRTGDYARYMHNGEVEFRGRRDTQIKINGYRIELAEIEAALTACGGVDAVAATVVGRDSGAPRIVAFVATQTPVGASPYLTALRAKLPTYMMPAEIREVERLPLTDNGKCDQQRLRQWCLERESPSGPTAPGHRSEARVAGVFARLLGGREPDATRNLFELGVNSLHLVQAFNELREELPEGFSVTQMFAFPTVRELASLIGREPAQAPTVAMTPSPPQRNPQGRDIAVVGLSARLPGGRNIEEFWGNLAGGVESIRRLSDAELRAPGAERLKSDPSFVPVGAVIDNVESFDAAFFGMDRREAELCDPQHRVFLECAWEALERAGCDPARSTDRVGVFAGTNMSTYLLSNLDPGMATKLDGLPGLIGNDKDYLTTRVSYRLNLRGPSVTVQTACSTSLVAVHMACQSLLTGECDLALAGGVTINVPQMTGYRYQEDGPVSPDGHCRAFDARGQGTVLGNGAGVVALKRLSDAVADGDVIEAVIKGSAINNDGKAKVGFTAPSARGQAEVIAQALAAAGVSAETIGYVEAHGTGTALGDPIEVAALRTVFEGHTANRQYCALGSVKTNVGHLDSAAGVAGLIKAVLCLRHRQLVPSLHYQQANPAIAFDSSPFYVNTRLRDWPAPPGGPRRAGVSSFGIGGTNAHVVLEEPPVVEPAPTEPDSREWLLPVSARSASALAARRAQWDSYLSETRERAAAIGYTAAVRRSQHRYRTAVVGRSPDEWRAALVRAAGRAAEESPRLCWIFAGQGPQSEGMGSELWREEPVFRQAVAAAAEALAHAGWTRPRLFARPLSADEQEDSAIIQPALFSLQWGLAALWRSWGIAPAAVAGHSLGEVAAACVAGALTLAEAARVVVERSRLLAGRRGQGAMVAVELGPEAVRQRIAEWGSGVELAVWNSPTSCVVSGERTAVEAWTTATAADGVRCRRLRTSGVAGHSACVEGLDAELAARLVDLQPRRATVRFLSSVDGRELDGEALDARYWGRNLREPVRFAAAVEAGFAHGVTGCVELSAHPVLTAAVAECAGERRVVTVGSLTREVSERRALLESAGRLWEAGAELDWTALYGTRGRMVTLPDYPWQRQRYWLEPMTATPPVNCLAGMPLYHRRFSSPVLEREVVYEGQLDLRWLPFLSDHRVHGQMIAPGSLLFELLLEAACAGCSRGRPTLRDVTLHAPLTVDEMMPVAVQAITSEASDSRTIRIYAQNEAGGWTLHASAVATESHGTPPDLPGESWHRIREAPRTEIDCAAMYAAIAKLGVEYGPEFRSVVQAWRGAGEALAQVRGTASAEWRLDPVLLDGCLQALSATLDDETQLYVPAGCDTFRYFAPVTGPAWSYVLTRRESTTDRLMADVHVIDDAGQVAAELLGMQFAPIAPNAYWASARSIERALCEVQWVRVERPTSPGRTLPGSVLLVGRGDAADAFAGAFRERGSRLATLGRGADLRARLTESVGGLTRTGGLLDVVSLLALDGLDVESCCRETLEILQTVAESADEGGTRCWVVTRGAWPIEAEGGGDLAQSAVWGLVRTAALEHPEIAPSLLDLDPRTDSIAPLLDRWREAGPSEQLALRDGRLYSPRLVPAAVVRSERSDRFAGGGSFLITGAFGGLGGRLAEWMARQGARRLVMAGRRLSDRGQSQIDALQRTGVEVFACLADVSDEHDVHALLRRIPAAFRPLRGVFHLALELADASVLNQTPDSLRRPLLSKAQAAWHLHRATEALPIEHFVLFSSVLSVLGGAGQANYTAACAAVDALASYRRAQGLPALAIGWGPWEFAGSAGLAAVQRTQQPFSAMYPMPEASGFKILETLLGASAPSVAIAAFDRREWKRGYGRCSPVLDQLESAVMGPAGLDRWRSAIRTARPAQRTPLIEQYLAAEIAARLRTAADQLSLDEPMTSYAIDSLAMLEVRSHISDDLGVVAPPRMFLENPTIRLLARALEARMAARESATDPEGLRRTLERIDDLSEEEVEATLARLEGGTTAGPGLAL